MTNDNSGSEDDDAVGEESPGRKYPDHLLEQGRERGLSKADREYLASGGDTITPESENAHINIRHRIRSRARESIVDFWLLSEYLSDHDRDLIFRESKDDWDNWELQIGIKSAIQFFYTALGETDLADFETVLTSAIHDAEHKMRNGPVLVDVDFDVEVDEQFHVEEAYNKFQRGVPLSPMEVGTLLVTGKIHDAEEVRQLSRHARSNSFIEYSVAPLLDEQLSSIGDEDERFDRFWYAWGHLSDEYPPETGSVPQISDFQYLEDEYKFQQNDAEAATVEDFDHREFVDGIAQTLSKGLSGAAAEQDEALRELSMELDEPIAIGDVVVYEDGDRHLLDSADGDEKGGGSPADTDDDADGAED